MSPGEIVTRYQNGESIRQIAGSAAGKRNGGRERAVRAAIKAAGLARPRSDVARLGWGLWKAKIAWSLSPEEVVERYKAGASKRALATELWGKAGGNYVGRITALLVAHNVKLRSMSEAAVNRQKGKVAHREPAPLPLTRQRTPETARTCECQTFTLGSVTLGHRWCRRCGKMEAA